MCTFIVFHLAACDDGNNSTSVQVQTPAVTVSAGEAAGEPTDESTRLQLVADTSILEQRIKDELTKRYERQKFSYYYRDANLSLPQMAAADSKGSSSQTLSAYSTTNLQEYGVDEGDLVKTDGTYLYLARGSHFIVLQAQPAAGSAVISDIELKAWITELYLGNGKVYIVTASNLSTKVLSSASDLAPPSTLSFPATRLYVYDVANPARPELTVRYDLPGALQGGRRINNTLYLVTNHRIDIPFPAYPWDFARYGTFEQKTYEQAIALARKENLRKIASLTLADMIPSYSHTSFSGATAGITQTTTAVDYGDIYCPTPGNGTDLAIIYSIDTLQESDAVSSSAIFTAWGTLYMSAESLYLASSNNWAWITPIADSGQELANPEPSTALHKFTISGPEQKPVYRGSGKVPGWLNNQFSLGEYNGYLRVGTTRGGWWGEQISNRLTIFAEQDRQLDEIGKIDNIAPGERIYSIRFDGDRAYMVTFRQTDPLFTLDLSNPAEPKIAGEIHVNGFSTYIHLIGENNNFLLTIGRSADSLGRVTGNKLQLFDVTNFAAPALVDDFELGAGWSSALYDHHAFLYYQPLSLLAIPTSEYSGTDFSYRSGLRLFSIDPVNGFGDRGSIRTSTIATPYGSYSDNVDRAVIINNNIYAIATESVTVAELDPLQVLKTVELPRIYRDYMIY
ncbi:MAG: beta-propeller domain-containing protein [Desulfuromonadales bacterium]|nr:beta-propeller domain-containing protein [Desulfuromonadales bacterium]